MFHIEPLTLITETASHYSTLRTRGNARISKPDLAGMTNLSCSPGLPHLARHTTFKIHGKSLC